MLCSSGPSLILLRIYFESVHYYYGDNKYYFPFLEKGSTSLRLLTYIWKILINIIFELSLSKVLSLLFSKLYTFRIKRKTLSLWTCFSEDEFLENSNTICHPWQFSWDTIFENWSTFTKAAFIFMKPSFDLFRLVCFSGNICWVFFLNTFL